MGANNFIRRGLGAIVDDSKGGRLYHADDLYDLPKASAAGLSAQRTHDRNAALRRNVSPSVALSTSKAVAKKAFEDDLTSQFQSVKAASGEDERQRGRRLEIREGSKAEDKSVAAGSRIRSAISGRR
jgi:hypothetical protein